MRTSLRFTLAAACAAGLAAAPAALAVNTTIRVEGGAANLIPESAIPIEGSGTAQVFDKNFAPVDVSRASAFWQLYRATASTGLGLGFEYFPAFTSILVQKIGPDENAGTVGWQYRVDHVAPPVGADQKALAQGDSTLWYFGGADGARELDVAPSADRVPAGGTFSVAVTSYGADGAAAPGAGARVAYGGAAAVADAAGRATFVAQAAGTRTVSATRAGDIRSAARAVCSFAGDPSSCNLPPAAAPGAAAAGGERGHRRPGQPHHEPAAGRALARREGDHRHRRPGPLGRRERRGRPGPSRRHPVPLPRPLGRAHPAAPVRAPALREGALGRRLLEAVAGQGPQAGRLARLEPRHGRGGQPRGRGAAADQHRPVPRRPMRRAALAVVAAGLALAAPAAATAAPSDAVRAKRAAAWLAGAAAGAPGGQQADAIVAMRAAGRGAASLRPRLRALSRVAPAYATTAGGAGKVALAAVAAGADPARVGGLNYLARIRARYASGRFGATAYDQAFSILALVAARKPVPRDAVRATMAGRGAGGWSFALSPATGDSVNATAIVVEALRAAGVPRTDRRLAAAAAWMLAQRNAEGGLASAGGGRPTDANSTAGAIRALRALGRRPPARTLAALRSLQEPSGAVRFTAADAGSTLIATTDATIAFSGKMLPVR